MGYFDDDAASPSQTPSNSGGGYFDDNNEQEQSVEKKRGYGERIARGAAIGVLKGIPTQLGALPKLFGAKELGQAIEDVAKPITPEETPGDAIEEGVSMIMSFAPSMLVPALARAQMGLLAADTYNKKLEEAQAAGVENPEMIAGAHAALTLTAFGFLSKFGKSISNPAIKSIMGSLAKKTPREMLVPNVKATIKDIALHGTLAASIFSGAAAAGSVIDKESGVRPDANVAEDVKASLGPTAVMLAGGGLISGAARMVHQKSANKIAATLSDKDANPAHRMHYANTITKFMEQKNPEIAKVWEEYAAGKIGAKEAIDLDISFNDPIALGIEAKIAKNQFKDVLKTPKGEAKAQDIVKDESVKINKEEDVSEAVGEEPKEQPSLTLKDREEVSVGFLKKLRGVKNVSVGLEGELNLQLKNGMEVTISKVDYISPDEVALNAAIGRQLKPGEYIAGSYKDGKIKLVRDGSGKWHFHHESVHLAEDFGLITKAEVEQLRRQFLREAAAGYRIPSNPEEIGGPEDRANYLADISKLSTEPKGVAKKVFARLQEWADRIMEAYGKPTTIERTERAFTSGRVFERTPVKTLEEARARASVWDERSRKAGKIADVLEKKSKQEGMDVRKEQIPSAAGETKIIQDVARNPEDIKAVDAFRKHFKLAKDADIMGFSPFKDGYTMGNMVNDFKKRNIEKSLPSIETKDKNPIWYSQMERVVSSKLPNVGDSQNIKKIIQSWADKGEFKGEELKWSGINEWLDAQKGKVTKQQVVDFLSDNRVKIEEITKEDKPSRFLVMPVDEIRDYCSSKKKECDRLDRVMNAYDEEVSSIEKEGGFNNIGLMDDREWVDFVPDGEAYYPLPLPQEYAQRLDPYINSVINFRKVHDEFNIAKAALEYKDVAPNEKIKAKKILPVLEKHLEDVSKNRVVSRDIETALQNVRDVRRFIDNDLSPKNYMLYKRAILQHEIDKIDLLKIERDIELVGRKYGYEAVYDVRSGKFLSVVDSDYFEMVDFEPIPEKIVKQISSELSEQVKAYKRREELINAINETNLFYRLEKDTQTEWKNITLPGGENYKEVLMTLPSIKGTFKSAHWKEENVVVHLRMTDRTTMDSETGERGKSLNWEEGQSDWQQKARVEGISEKVPDAPFKSWFEMASRRMLRFAAEGDYDYLTWNTGEQNRRIEGYSNIGSISWEKIDYLPDETWIAPDSVKRVFLYPKNGYRPVVEFSVKKDGTVYDSGNKEIEGRNVIDVLGKEIGNKILGDDKPYGKLKDQDLAVLGKHLIKLYDEMIPAYMNKYLKKWGVKTQEVAINTGDTNSDNVFEQFKRESVHAVPITPEMRKSIMEGQPQYSIENREQLARNTRDADIRAFKPFKDDMTMGELIDSMKKRSQPSIDVKEDRKHYNMPPHGGKWDKYDFFKSKKDAYKKDITTFIDNADKELYSKYNEKDESTIPHSDLTIAEWVDYDLREMHEESVKNALRDGTLDKKLYQEEHADEYGDWGSDKFKFIFGDIKNKNAVEIVKLPFNATSVPEDVIDGHRYNGKDITNAKPGERGSLGNPFKATDAGGKYTREEAVRLYKDVFLKRVNNDREFREWVKSIPASGKKLGYYKPEAEVNHLQVVQDYLDGKLDRKVTPQSDASLIEQLRKEPAFRDSAGGFSNFSPYSEGEEMVYGGLKYKSNEHFYHAMKFKDQTKRALIAKHPFKGLKAFVRSLGEIRSDWDTIKDDVMKFGLKYKFNIPRYKSLLLSSGNEPLVERNTWNDKYWGEVKGEGQNKLGKMLMDLRSEFKGEPIKENIIPGAEPAKAKEQDAILPKDQNAPIIYKDLTASYFKGSEKFEDYNKGVERARKAERNAEEADITAVRRSYDFVQINKEMALVAKEYGYSPRLFKAVDSKGRQYFFYEKPLYLGKSGRLYTREYRYIRNHPEDTVAKETFYDKHLKTDKDWLTYMKENQWDKYAYEYYIKGTPTEILEKKYISNPDDRVISGELKKRADEEAAFNKEELERTESKETITEEDKRRQALADNFAKMEKEMSSLGDEITKLQSQKDDNPNKWTSKQEEELLAKEKEFNRKMAITNYNLSISKDVIAGKKMFGEDEAIEEPMPPVSKEDAALDRYIKLEDEFFALDMKDRTPEKIKELQQADKEWQEAAGMEYVPTKEGFVDRPLLERPPAEEPIKDAEEVGSTNKDGLIDLGDGNFQRARADAQPSIEGAAYIRSHEAEDALVKHLEANKDKDMGIIEKLRLAEHVYANASGAKTAFENVVARSTGIFKALKNEYMSPAHYSNAQKHIMTYTGSKNISNLRNTALSKAFMEAHPERLRREAMRNWIECGGDKEYLKMAYEDCMKNENGAKRYAEGYKAALELTPAEIKTCELIREKYNEALHDLIEMDMLENGIENYINNEWEMRDEEAIKAMMRHDYEFFDGRLSPKEAYRRFLGAMDKMIRENSAGLHMDGDALYSKLKEAVDNSVSEYFQKDAAPMIDADVMFQIMRKAVNAELAPMSDRPNVIPAFKDLKLDPSFLYKKQFKTSLHAEVLGFKHKNGKDLGMSLIKYLNALDEAVAARKMMRDLAAGKAKDGRRIIIADRTENVKGAVNLDGTLNVNERTLLNGKDWEEIQKLTPSELRERKIDKTLMSPIDVAEYAYLDAPCMKNWKFVGLDENGNKAVYKGNIWVHKEYVKPLKAIMERSKVRGYTVEFGGKKFYPGNAALEMTSFLKGTLLSLSGFHQVQVGVHAIFHKVNPFKAPQIDVNDPVQRRLLMHGLNVSDFRGLEMFAEGLASGSGLVAKIPGLGVFMQRYASYLFQDYIPRLKMAMAVEAYERNVQRYHKGGKGMTKNQIAYLTSKQADAAFGELNYEVMGRSRTTQDVCRLMFLAPDFLEARARFVGQSLSPYGEKNVLRGIVNNEQFMAAVVRGGLGMFVGVRILNAILNDGDMKFDKPFSVALPKGTTLLGADIGEREYMIRSIPGDIMHLFKDPRSFVFYRVNPVFVKPFMEAVIGRDQFGRYRDSSQQINDYFTGFAPIPFQAKKGEVKVWESALRSLGFNVYKDRSSFEKKLLELKGKRASFSQTADERRRSDLISIFSDRLRVAKTAADRQEIMNDINLHINEGKLYHKNKQTILLYAREDRIMRDLKQMQIEDVLRAWGTASDTEKKKYRPYVIKKAYNLATSNPDRFREVLPEVKKIMSVE